MNPNALVTDFDGTITETDFFWLLWQRHIPPDAPDFLERWRRREITHFEAMQGYFDYSPTDMPTLEALMRDTAPDPDTGRTVRELKAAGWDVIVVSAGCSWYIQRILDGLPLTIHASPGEVVPGAGLRMRLPEESPFCSPVHGIDKPAVMRDTLSRYSRVAFAGDGPPDLEPCLLAPPELRFARRWLAEELDRRGEGFRTFTRWPEIADTLLKLP